MIIMDNFQSRKGVTGKVLTTVISLILALMALIVLWNFLISTSPLIKSAVDNIINSFKSGICSRGISSWPVINSLCKSVVGV